MCKILVIGERFTDRYFIGTSTRLSPEAPIPVVNIKEVIQFSGGAGNVVANLQALGAGVAELYQPGHYPIKNRLVSGGHQLARWDQDDTCEPFTALHMKLSKHLFKDVDGVVISDYNKGAFSSEGVAAIMEMVPQTATLFVDTKTSPGKYAILNNRTFFFPNMKEWAAHAESYNAMYNVVRKESEHGMTYLARGGRGAYAPALATTVVSVSGAGDTAMAAFAYAYCNGARPSEAIEFASRACAVVVSKPYTSVATLDEINQIKT
jgi:bifunctional ADP-heptose synthase (sugar kinase/adenylyltransferase)